MSKYRNGALDRRISVHYPSEENPNRTTSFYPQEKYLELLKGFAVENMESLSKVGSRIFKQFFDSLPDQERQRYMRSAKSYIVKRKKVNATSSDF